MRLLTKSKFKLGLECPNKLYYIRKKDFVNTKKEDFFLEALAQGGFQVEELARMHYPNGILIESNPWEYETACNQTQKLLKQENVVIYEAAFLVDGLFIRVDILVKKGIKLQLIEVKSKSFTPENEFLLIGKKGDMVAGWKPFLFDVAFQKYVIQQSFPSWEIKSFLMMVDKSKKTNINGLNQLFRITKKGVNRTGIEKRIQSLEETGDSVLSKKDITQIISDIESNKHLYYPDLSFQEAILLFKNIYEKDEYANWPTSYSSCKKCEFKCNSLEEEQGLKSGFKECFQKQHDWKENDFLKPNIFDIYDFRKGSKLFDDGIYFKSELTEDHIGLEKEPGKLTTSHRQWLQIEKDQNNDSSIYVDRDGLKEEMDKFVFHYTS